jgi:hypothetical protein
MIAQFAYALRPMERRTAANGVVYYISPLLERRGVPHAFSTRLGGKSPPPFDSLNLGNPSGCATQDDYGRIYENYDLLQHAVGLARRTRCWVHQVHGGAVVEVDGNFESGVKADAMVTGDHSRILAVRVADCVPVLLATDDGSRVAAIHAGWRGVIAGIVPAAVSRLRLSASSSATLVCAIGPSISLDAFEVGPEVIAQFRQQFGPGAPVKARDDDGKSHVDLRAAIALQLRSAGLCAENIDISDRCTFRDADEFFSHRRDRGVTGRMAALISPAGSAG